MKAAFFLIAALACIAVVKAYPRDDQEETNAVYETLASAEDSASLTHQTAYGEEASSEDGGKGKGKGGKGKGGKGKGSKGGKGGKKGGKGKGKGKKEDETAETAPADA